MNKNQKGFGAAEGLLILIIVGLIGFVGWYVWHAKNNVDKNLTAANAESSQIIKTISPYTLKSGYTTIKDSTFNYSFAYPTDWSRNDDKLAATEGFLSSDYSEKGYGDYHGAPLVTVIVEGSSVSVKASIQPIQEIEIDGLMTTKTISVDGLKATQKIFKYNPAKNSSSDAPDQYLTDTRFKSKNNVYVAIEFHSVSKGDSPSHNDVSQEILNSFRF